MDLPFTEAEFFEVFAAYNQAIWPFQLVLTAAAVAMVMLVLAAPARAGRVVSLGLAALWMWMALGYHLAYFWSINPAAPVFAAISLGAAGAFLWQGILRQSLRFRPGMNATKSLGLVVTIFALAGYPVVCELLGQHYPAAPSFGLPCPTTIFTFGVLLMAVRPVPGWVLAGPIAWALIGSGAAFLLGVPQDLVLLLMAALGGYMLWRDRSAFIRT